MKKVKISDLTQLELQIIERIKNVDNPQYFFMSEILTGSKEQNKVLRGAISSLVKKMVLDVNNDDGGLVSVYAKNLFPDCFFD